MTKLAGSQKPGSAVPKLSGLYQRYAVSPAAQKTLDVTFRTLCDLHDEGRDHIWSYYVRNLARRSTSRGQSQSTTGCSRSAVP
jgi:hypothetical protein